MAITIARASDLAAVGANAGAWTVDQGAAPPGQPSDITTTPAAPWTPVGAITDNGIARSFNEKTQDLYAMGVTTPYLNLVTQSTATFTFAVYESWRDIVKSIVYRKPLSEVAVAADGSWSFAETGTGIVDKRSWLIAVINGASMEWYYLPVATVAMTKDQTFSGDAAASIELEATPYPDDSGNTIYHIGQLPAGVYAA